MKLSLKEVCYERWLVRANVLESIDKTSLTFFAIPSLSFYEFVAKDNKVHWIAIVSILSIIALRSVLRGLLAKTKFRLELAKKHMEREQAP